ncbi:MAG: F0F1 ATP synthase subunit delta, partial [Lacunisphaera sp.]|nr:F0F1 ATP synthase subunit delta [Lacunisphaera sp.]
SRHLEHHRIKVVTVVSAQSLTPAQSGALTAKLAARLGCDVRLREQTDPALLAGLRLRIGDRVEDYTAAAQIRRFHKAVLNA